MITSWKRRLRSMTLARVHGLWSIVCHVLDMVTQQPYYPTVLFSLQAVQGPGGDLVYTVRSEVFNPYSGLWKNVNSITTPRGFHTVVLLNNGNVLVAGGLTLPANSPNRTATAELFVTSSSKWTSTGSMSVPRSAAAYGGALLSNGRFFIAEGRTDTAEVYSPNTGIWELLSNMAVSRSFHTVTLLSNGTILVSGGENADGFIATAEIYTP